MTLVVFSMSNGKENLARKVVAPVKPAGRGPIFFISEMGLSCSIWRSDLTEPFALKSTSA